MALGEVDGPVVGDSTSVAPTLPKGHLCLTVLVEEKKMKSTSVLSQRSKRAMTCTTVQPKKNCTIHLRRPKPPKGAEGKTIQT